MPTLPDKKKTSYQIELERRSNDLLRVYNPMDTDYVVVWDLRSGGNRFRVPAKGEAVLVRYIAEKYVKEMYEKILNDKAREAILKENERRVKAGMSEMDKTFKTNEQMVFEQKFYKPSNEESRKIISLLYVGLETEYGVDKVYEEEEQKASTRDFGSVLKDVESEKANGSTVNEEKEAENGSGEASGTYKCDFPGCDYETEHKIGLFQHKKTHRKEDNIVTA